ncbi:Hypothetical protein SRAE_2000169200 [Strongyloides ratti]|uniref:Uncharacterized protein n=1 Tax=Strongyloides ratti TaxID=34506 RepID=A0A090LB90_STRRB|nr:Hypothetical protein SRAE_2000169200 [Strongyloides ratti]CEF67027.1 Hypothetical protein SRAE_2000169200 [Strongyloides ratti]
MQVYTFSEISVSPHFIFGMICLKLHPDNPKEQCVKSGRRSVHGDFAEDAVNRSVKSIYLCYCRYGCFLSGDIDFLLKVKWTRLSCL